MTADRIEIAFEGGGAGEGPLSWGQLENWATIQATKSWFPLGGASRLLPGTTMGQVVELMRYAMVRYPVLRTRLRFEPDGRVVQVVHAHGGLELGVVEAGARDPAKVAAELCDRWRAQEIDFARDWPLRVAVIVQDGQPSHMATLISHLAVDAAGLETMIAEMAALKAAPVAGIQPLEQATWQRSAAGGRQNAGALRYWEGVYRTISPHRFARRGGQAGPGPRYRHGEFDSAVLLPAVRALAVASGLSSSTVFLALYATALRDIGAVEPVVIRPIVSNRFRPGVAAVVCTVAQAGILVVDVADVPFDEALRRVNAAVMPAYKYAYFNHGDMLALEQRVARERGVEFELGVFVNDRHVFRMPPDLDAAAAARAVEAAAASVGVLRWTGGQDGPALEPLFVEIDDLPELADGIRIGLHLDTRHVSLADAEALACAMERTALAAARSAAAAA